MLAEVRVVLVRQTIKICIGETHVSLITAACQGNIVLLVEACAEDITPRIICDGLILPHRAIIVVYVTTIILRTEISCTVLQTAYLLSCTIGICIPTISIGACTALWGWTRAKFSLVLRHISHKVAGPAGIEVNAYAS